MYSVAALSLLVLLATILTVESAQPKLCRCEASFESLYDRRHRDLLLGLDRGLKLSTQNGFPYDYGTAYTIDGGFFVIDGVIVLPENSKVCQALDQVTFGGRRSLLVENLKEDCSQHHSHALRGKLQIGQQEGKERGLKGRMLGAVDSQGYYSYGGGKADGKGVRTRRELAKVMNSYIEFSNADLICFSLIYIL
jgi:hypothetical protein